MWKIILTVFLIWRIALFFIAAFGGNFLDFVPRFPYADVFLFPSKLPQWFWSFANFDGVHYLTIAKSGYSAQFTQVFFPLYPILIAILSTILPFNKILIGLFISNIFFVAMLFMLVKLLALDFKSNLIITVLLILISFPTSFYFGSLYTESFFVFLVLGSFYSARTNRWWLAGVFGALAGATRFVGIFLLPALLWEWNQQHSKYKISNIKNTNKKSNIIKRTINFLLTIIISTLRSPVLYIVPIGLISYMVYLFIKHNDPLYFWHVQPVFGAFRSGSGIVLLPQVFFRYARMIVTVSPSSPAFFNAAFELLATLVAIVLLLIAQMKKVRISYLIFSWLAVLTPTFTGTLSSMPRYILVAFPIYIALALQLHTKMATILTVFVSCILLSLLVILFTSGRWVA